MNNAGMDDHELIEKLKQGHNESYRLVVDKYQAMVLNCTFKFLRSREAAEDVTQEVFLEVFESIHSFRQDAKLSTWIYRIAVTKSLNMIKSSKRKKRLAVLTSLFGQNSSEESLAAPQDTHPDYEIENQDRVRVLTWALDKLPENQRVAFTLSKYKEMSYEEISAMMEVTIPAVESLLHRANKALRKHLAVYYTRHL